MCTDRELFVFNILLSFWSMFKWKIYLIKIHYAILFDLDELMLKLKEMSYWRRTVPNNVC